MSQTFENGDLDLQTNKIWFNNRWRSKGAYAAAKCRAKKMKEDKEYLKKESAKRRALRQKKSARLRELEAKEAERMKAEAERTKVDLSSSEAISETRSRMRGEGKRSATASTVDTYKKRCAALAREMGDEKFDIDNPQIFKDTKKVIAHILGKTKNSNTQQFYLSCVKSVLQYRKGYEKAYQEYFEAHKNIENPYLNNVGANRLLPHEKDILEWGDLTRDVNKAMPNLAPRDAVISALYVYAPPRRADYAVMRVIKVGSEIDPRFNYVIVNKRGDVKEFVFNRYKTQKRYGQQRFPVKGKLAAILEEYITELGKKNNDFLFTTSAGKPLKKNSFTKLIPLVFERITGTQMSINDLRKSCISYYLNKNISLNQKRILSDKMAHSVATQQIYQKQDLD